MIGVRRALQATARKPSRYGCSYPNDADHNRSVRVLFRTPTQQPAPKGEIFNGVVIRFFCAAAKSAFQNPTAFLFFFFFFFFSRAALPKPSATRYRRMAVALQISSPACFFPTAAHLRPAVSSVLRQERKIVSKGAPRAYFGRTNILMAALFVQVW